MDWASDLVSVLSTGAQVMPRLAAALQQHSVSQAAVKVYFLLVLRAFEDIFVQRQDAVRFQVRVAWRDELEKRR
ncbi:hypothetical protein GN956_G4518 [Arapaima gigas]